MKLKLKSFCNHLGLLWLGPTLSLQAGLAQPPFPLPPSRAFSESFRSNGSKSWMRLSSWGWGINSLNLFCAPELRALKAQAQGGYGKLEASVSPSGGELEWTAQVFSLCGVKKALTFYIHLAPQSHPLDLGVVSQFYGQWLRLSRERSAWELRWDLQPKTSVGSFGTGDLELIPQICQFAQSASSSSRQEPQVSEPSYSESHSTEGEAQNYFDPMAHPAALVQIIGRIMNAFNPGREVTGWSVNARSICAPLIAATALHSVIVPCFFAQATLKAFGKTLEEENLGWVGSLFEIEHNDWVNLFASSDSRDIFFKTTACALKFVWTQNYDNLAALLSIEMKGHVAWLLFLKLMPPSTEWIQKMEGELKKSPGASLGDWAYKTTFEVLKTDYEGFLKTQETVEKLSHLKGFGDWNSASNINDFFSKLAAWEKRLQAVQTSGDFNHNPSLPNLTVLDHPAMAPQGLFERYWFLKPTPFFWKRVFALAKEDVTEQEINTLTICPQSVPILLIREHHRMLENLNNHPFNCPLEDSIPFAAETKRQLDNWLKSGKDPSEKFSIKVQLSSLGIIESCKKFFRTLGEPPLLGSIRAFLSFNPGPFDCLFINTTRKKEANNIVGIKELFCFNWRQLEKEQGENFWSEWFEKYPVCSCGCSKEAQAAFLAKVFQDPCFEPLEEAEFKKTCFFFWDAQVCGEAELKVDDILGEWLYLNSLLSEVKSEYPCLKPIESFLSLMHLVGEGEQGGYFKESYKIYQALKGKLRTQYTWEAPTHPSCFSEKLAWEKIELRLKGNLLADLEKWQRTFPKNVVREIPASEIQARQEAIIRLTRLTQAINKLIQALSPLSSQSEYALAYQDEIAQFRNIIAENPIDSTKAFPFDCLIEPVSGFLMKEELVKLESIKKHLDKIERDSLAVFYNKSSLLTERHELTEQISQVNTWISQAEQPEPSAFQSFLEEIPEVPVYRHSTGNNSSVNFSLGGGGFSVGWSWKW